MWVELPWTGLVLLDSRELSSPFLHLKIQSEDFCLHIGEQALTKSLTTLAPWSWTSSPQNYKEWISVIHKPPYFVIAAWIH